jgi:hypothetical protein
MPDISLKSQYLEGANGLTQKLADAFELGRRFIRPQFDDVALKDSVAVSTTSPHFTIANSGSNSVLLAGYTVRYDDAGTEVERVIASPLTLGSTFDVTAVPPAVVSGKSLRYSSPRPAAYTTLANELAAAAAAGKTNFTVSIETSDNPSYLRLLGNYMNSYFAGIEFALEKEGIFTTYEVKISLDTSDTLATKIKFAFSFC